MGLRASCNGWLSWPECKASEQTLGNTIIRGTCGQERSTKPRMQEVCVTQLADLRASAAQHSGWKGRRSWLWELKDYYYYYFYNIRTLPIPHIASIYPYCAITSCTSEGGEQEKKHTGTDKHLPFQLIQTQTGQGPHRKWQLLVRKKEKS